MQGYTEERKIYPMQNPYEQKTPEEAREALKNPDAPSEQKGSFKGKSPAIPSPMSSRSPVPSKEADIRQASKEERSEEPKDALDTEDIESKMEKTKLEDKEKKEEEKEERKEEKKEEKKEETKEETKEEVKEEENKEEKKEESSDASTIEPQGMSRSSSSSSLDDKSGPQIVWSMQTKKGKPVSLHVGGKVKQFEEKVREGCYMLYAFTTASLPGGDKGPRYVAADIHVKSKEGKTMTHEVFKLHSAEKTLAIEWVVPKGEMATVFIQFRLNSPVGPFKVMAKMFRRDHPATDGEGTIDTSYSTSLDSLVGEMKGETEVKKLARDCGMIRPFLLLSAMHPAARQQVADILGMSLYGTYRTYTYSSHFLSDPELENNGQLEAWKIISKNRKGMQAKCMHSYESLNPRNWKAGNGANWFEVLYRVMTEVHKGEMSFKEEMKSLKSKEEASCSRDDKRMEQLEVRLLNAIAETFFDQKKKDEDFQTRFNQLIQKDNVKDMMNRIREKGVDNENVLRFTVGYAMCLLDEQKEKEDKKEELRSNEAEKQDKMAKFLGSREYTASTANEDETKDFVTLIRERLLLGQYDPRSAGQKGMAYAKKAGIWLGKKGAKQVGKQYIAPMVIAPIFPPILLPWMVGNLVHKFTGADHEALYLVVVQLLLQRLLLAAHGVDINEYF
ncbi:hypothetical protein PROFUN_02618 [Planoprotostelium fungivorum]|uniref:Uncharacterized protein n=1 Tax=Planoprotostelium fungivorum TaxID=1890364 RepID=A0A2P6NV84_9EUKA|nr:hypothetical protein PROFUN_02618 [Planoprotostelium fungivorum]